MTAAVLRDRVAGLSAAVYQEGSLGGDLPRTRRILVLCLSMAIGACVDDPDPVVCTAIAVSSLAVTVRDAVTAQPVCDARVVALQGGTTYELRPLGEATGCTYSGPEERSGLFDVRVTKAGYEDAAVTNVRVTADECHVIPVQLTVDVRPGG